MPRPLHTLALIASALAAGALYWFFMPNQTVYSPGQAFPVSPNADLLLLTVTQDSLSRAQIANCSACSYPQPGIPAVTPSSIDDVVKTSIRVAEQLSGETWSEPIPTVTGIEGSSGGLAFTLAAWSELTSSTWTDTVAATGTVYPDGSVRPVQGTQAKSELAQANNVDLLLVPTGSDIATSYTGQVAYVDTVEQAIEQLCERPEATCADS